MRPAKFAYLAPVSAVEALDALERYADEARLLAGGQSLVPMMNLRVARPAFIIDLNRCADLFYLREQDGSLVIGAMVRQGAAERDRSVVKRCPLLYKALGYVGSPSSRARGTIGGSFAQADPSAELPAVALALDAVFIARSQAATRAIPASDFFVGPLSTALQPNEMLVEIRMPAALPATRSAFVESGNRSHDLAIAGVAAQAQADTDGRYRQVRLAALGAGHRPMRLRGAESLLEGANLDDCNVSEVVEAAMSEIDPQDDAIASAAYRRKLLCALVARALHQLKQGSADGT